MLVSGVLAFVVFVWPLQKCGRNTHRKLWLSQISASAWINRIGFFCCGSALSPVSMGKLVFCQWHDRTHSHRAQSKLKSIHTLFSIFRTEN